MASRSSSSRPPSTGTPARRDNGASPDSIGVEPRLQLQADQPARDLPRDGRHAGLPDVRPDRHGPQPELGSTDTMGPLGQLAATVRAARRRLADGRSRIRARGQMLVLFVISIFVLTGITAIVVDVSVVLGEHAARPARRRCRRPGRRRLAARRARQRLRDRGRHGHPERLHGRRRRRDRSRASRTRRTTGACGSPSARPVNTFFMKIFGIQSMTRRPACRRRSMSCRCRWAARRTTTASSG